MTAVVEEKKASKHDMLLGQVDCLPQCISESQQACHATGTTVYRNVFLKASKYAILLGQVYCLLQCISESQQVCHSAGTGFTAMYF